MQQPKMTTTKTWVAALGGTLTATTTGLASVSVALDDGALDAGEYGLLATAAATLVSTVFAIWRVPNKVVDTKV